MKMDETKICVGIDLGTTNTSAAYSRLGLDGQIKLEDLEIRQKGRGAQRTYGVLPSIMYRKPDGEEVVGSEAQDLKNNSILSADEEIRYLENTKRYIGTRKTFQIDDKVYTPIEVATLILNHVKNYSAIKKISDEYYTIITVPANFNNDQRNDTLEAAHRAGFKNVELYDEPKAAILSFLHDESLKREDKLLDVSTQKRILVIDIGGGTCDISVEDVEARSGQYIFKHHAVGRKDLGGIDFDKRVGDELAKRNLRGITPTPAEISSLRDIGQRAKESLSDFIDEFIWDNYEDSSKLYEDPNWLDILDEEGYEFSLSREIRGQTVNFSMSVRDFVNAINPLIYKMDDAVAVNKDERDRNKNMELLINTTLSDYDIDIDSIDLIFLTGGMAKCFPLRAALYELYGKKVISPSKPFLAVSRGAALVNKYKSIDESSKDLMPNAVMIEMSDGRLRTLVKMGEQVPVTNTVPGTFKTVSRNGVVIRLFEGKNEYDSQLRRINNLYVIKFPEPQKSGREFEIKYSVDRTKRISFTITFLDTGEEHYISGQIREGK